MAESINTRLHSAFVDRDIRLLRFDAGLRQRILAMLRELEGELVTRLTSADPTAPVRTAFQRRRLTALLAETRTLLRQGYRGIHRLSRRELVELAGLEITAVNSTINAELGANLMRSGLTDERLRALVDDTFISGGSSRAATIKDWWSTQAEDFQRRFAQTMRQGMLQDETVAQLVRRVRGTRAGRFQDGIAAISRRNAETLVRTAVNGVANTAREATFRANPQVIRGVAASTTLDSRTCLVGQTQIFTPHGWTAIADLQVGNLVFTIGGEVTPVIHTLQSTTTRLTRLRLSTGREIVCTPDHRFLIRLGYWAEAQRLEPGEDLATIEWFTEIAGPATVVSIEHYDVEPTPVYDIQLRVGECFMAEGVIAHNSAICISRSGAAWNLADGRPLPESTRQEPYPGSPPWHMRCRTTLTAVTRTYSDLLRQSEGVRAERALRQLDPDTRALLDAKPPTQQTYPAWLRGQPEAKQRRILGPRRWELWQEGRLSLHELVDQSGNPLTLAQLRDGAD